MRAAREYQALKPKLMCAVLDSYARVKAEADLVLVEGAGSAAELNLREGDIANMGFARAANSPVVLIGDIDRGGIFAQILGVKTALAPEDAATIVGFIVNKFRGDATLFEGAMATIAERTGWRAFGLLPFFADAARLPAEDAFGLGDKRARPVGAVTIAVPMLARIANFDDFDPLRMEPSVRLVFVRPGVPLPLADLVILPGSKATIADLKFFREQGWDIDLLAHARRGGRILGICGGYQMLGKNVSDPQGMEGPPGEIEGLGLLDVATVLTGDEDAEASRRRVPHEWRAVPGLRDACRRDERVQTARGRSCASPTGSSTARSRQTASSRGPMCMGCSPTIASARPGSRCSERRAGSAMRPRSSIRSTRSRTIARRISIATRCSRPLARGHCVCVMRPTVAAIVDRGRRDRTTALQVLYVPSLGSAK